MIARILLKRIFIWKYEKFQQSVSKVVFVA
jgi:hypothetical protein